MDTEDLSLKPLSDAPKIKTVRQLRQTDKASFYIPRNNALIPPPPCEPDAIPTKPMDLRITGKPGRNTGEAVLYDPIQIKNYLSQSARYERSLGLLPLGIKQDGNNFTYEFCKFQVTLEGGGTFLRFTNPLLTIICPRPFQLQDLVGVETDGTGVIWEQLQGRITIISPTEGESSLNPFLSIIGNRTPIDPPIILLATLDDNPLVSDAIAIRTTLTETIDGLSGCEIFAPQGSPCLSVPCQLTPLPNPPNTAYRWTQPTVEVLWQNPTCEQAWLVEYQLQQNINGAYQTIATYTPQQERRFTATRNTYYRILAIYNVLSAGFSANDSCRFFFGDQTNIVFASDRISGIAGADGRLTATQYPLSVQTRMVSGDRLDGVSGGDGRLTATQYPLLTQTRMVSGDLLDGLSGGDGQLTATQYNLTGAIIG